MTKDDLDQLAINTIRTLSIDAVQQAKSGHPGTPMALAPLVYAIWNRVMRFDPRIRSGPTATDSCCPTAMPRCCCGRCCI
jgi:transketolase N-terminal domain/subunit